MTKKEKKIIEPINRSFEEIVIAVGKYTPKGKWKRKNKNKGKKKEEKA